MTPEARTRIRLHAERLADEANRLVRLLQRSTVDESAARDHLGNICTAAERCWREWPVAAQYTEQAIAPPGEVRAQKKERRRVKA